MIEAHASTPTGPVVHIKDATASGSYFCANGHEVGPVQGNTLPWHYRHREVANCSIVEDDPDVGWGPPPV